MFEAITVNRRIHPNLKQPFSIGHIAECLLFYDHVNVIVSPTELEQLVRICGVENLIELLSTNALAIHLHTSSLGSTQAPNTSRIGYGILRPEKTNIEIITYKSIQNVYKHAHKSKDYQIELLPFIQEYNDDTYLLEKYLANNDFTTKAFREIVKQNFPDYPVPLDLIYNLHKDEPRHAPNELVMNSVYDIDTNFDIRTFEQNLNKLRPGWTTGFAVTFMMSVAGAIDDIGASAQFNSEISTEESSTPIIQNAINQLDSYVGSKENNIREFNEFVVSGFPSVSDTINSGKRSFYDFMKLINHSKQFKEWLKKTPIDSSVVREYIKANDIESFSNSNLLKALKFFTVAAPIAFSGISTISEIGQLKTTVDLLTGAIADTSADYIAKKFNKWKPNQFVQKDLKHFATR